MDSPKLTYNQARYLTILQTGPKTVSQIKSTTFHDDTKDMIHSSLRRMEDRELVRRLIGRSRPSIWELTASGRKAIAAFTK